MTVRSKRWQLHVGEGRLIATTRKAKLRKCWVFYLHCVFAPNFEDRSGERGRCVGVDAHCLLIYPILQDNNPIPPSLCLSRLGGEGGREEEWGGRTSDFRRASGETGYALCIIADVSGSKTRSQTKEGKRGKLFRAMQKNPIFVYLSIFIHKVFLKGTPYIALHCARCQAIFDIIMCVKTESCFSNIFSNNFQFTPTLPNTIDNVWAEIIYTKRKSPIISSARAHIFRAEGDRWREGGEELANYYLSPSSPSPPPKKGGLPIYIGW